MRGIAFRRGLIAAGAAVMVAASAAPAWAAFPYPPPAPGSNPRDYTQYKLPPGVVPNEIPQDGNAEYKFAATPEPGNDLVNANPQELNGVRGASVADDDPSALTAFEITTGRPDVTVATLDSGIKWNEQGPMVDLRRKVRLNRGELPVPLSDRTTSLETGGKPCNAYDDGEYDANRDGVFNVVDYACDSRVERDPATRAGRGQPRGVGPADLLDPQDVLIAFSTGTSYADVDNDHNGYVDDIAGWDFLDDDNDPYDDVQYGHGTGESLDAAGEADNRVGGNGKSVSMCPNCTVIPLRVGDSFVADVDNFAQAAVYATDNGALVIQEALGALNNSALARQAVDYAYRHGVTTIASAADESAQHHNWPSSYPHVIIVNSVTKYKNEAGVNETPKSYLLFNACTNFSSKITVAVPSKECSSDATGKGGAMAGLIYSAALNARAQGNLPQPSSGCRRPDGTLCVITPNEVRQAMASGTIGGQSMADDVNFATQPEPSCISNPTPICTNPMLNVTGNYVFNFPLVPESRRFPSRKGHDQFFGYGRTNMRRTIAAVTAGDLEPEAEIDSPDWFAQIDPARAGLDVTGHVGARGAPYTCRVEVAPGSYPNNGRTTDTLPGDFSPVPSSLCNSTTSRTEPFDGVLGSIDIAALKARFPPNALGFNGREPGIGTVQTSNGRPNIEPYGFIVRVVVTRVQTGPPARTFTGEDRRNFYLHRDQDSIAGFPKKLPSDGAASPLLVDLDGDNRNELVVSTSGGTVHAYRSDGSELSGWPVQVDRLPLHTGDPNGAYATRQADSDARNSILASPAAGDLDHDGSPEVVVADLRGKVYAFDAAGKRVFTREINVDYSGKPLTPFADVRKGARNRTQHAFIASPVLADLDRNDGGRLEVVAAAMDRHVYAWNDDGSTVPGYPELVVDRTKITAIDPATHALTFGAAAGGELDQGAIIDTPAVGNIVGDAKPEIVVGTNEEYNAGEGNEGDFNLAAPNAASAALLSGAGVFSPANSRLYALKPEGDQDGNPGTGDANVPDWPFKVGLILPGILPVVGEGITGAPIIGPVDCPSGGSGRKVGVIPDAGDGYIVGPDAKSCYGQDNAGHDVGLQTDVSTGGPTGRYDTPAFPALGHPAFGNLGEGVSLLAPAIGLKRALDLQGNEYQGGQDFIGAWNGTSGEFRPGWPAAVNDLSFLTGPSVADIDGLAGEEVVSGTASLDLTALNTGGAPVNQKWPKLTSDWLVANPLIGSFGDRLDTAGDARKKRVVAITRSGELFVYDTDAPACSPGSWPRYHHDNANSGDYDRDALLPGAPMGVAIAAGKLNFTEPGDDMLCGKVDHYEIVASSGPLSAASFSSLPKLANPPAPVAAGGALSYTLPAGTGRCVGLRAVDDQGNVGRFVAVGSDCVASGSTGLPSGGPGSNPAGGNPAGGPTQGAPRPASGGATHGGCRDGLAPRSSIDRRRSRMTRRGLFVAGHSRDRGCGHTRVRRVELAIGRQSGRGCRFLLRSGRFSARRSCRRPLFLRARSTYSARRRDAYWRYSRRLRLARGRYDVTVRAVDLGNLRESRRLSARFARLRVR